MDFDGMMDAWKEQERTPLYGINRDLLRLVLRQERAATERTARREWWINVATGVGMIGLAAAILWWFVRFDAPARYAVAAALATAGIALWVGALWSARRRQMRTERAFGNSVEEEVRRSLAVVDHRLAQLGSRWTLALWSAPIAIGASLLTWLIAAINDNTTIAFDVSLVAFIIGSTGWTVIETSRRVRRELLPRRRRLGELLAMLSA